MMKSEKRLRFEKVAGKRVQKILDTLDLLSNCSNRSNYEFDEKDVEQMFTEISRHLRESRMAFHKSLESKNGKSEFKFD